MSALFLVVLIDVIAFTVVLPVLPFFAEGLGASPAQVGLIITLFAIGQFAAGPIMGKLSDRYGRKPILLLSQVVTTGSLAWLATANTLTAVFGARLLGGIGAANISVAQAFISDLHQGKDRAKAFGVIGIAFGIGFFVGPGLSGALAHYGDHAPMWGATALSGFSFIVNLFFLPDHKPRPMAHDTAPVARRRRWQRWTEFFESRTLRNLLIEFLLFNLAFTCFISGFALFAERRFIVNDRPFGSREMGFLYMYLGLLSIAMQGGLLRLLLRRFSERTLAHAGFISSTLGYIAFIFVRKIPAMVGAATLHSCGMGLIRPNLTSLIAENARRDRQGAVLGVSQSLASMASIVAPLISGSLIQKGQLGLWAGTCAVLSLMGLLFGWRAGKPSRKG